uniref:Uncharacterized protein LOC100372536 n=1 Tax=Saccoglossus kowalevskii TaxID=10224 RepID=A0ABM0MMC0_SACKO|nr:PREDICTED: uncharacterized protein LOC100372536 [Saccoglossus kowalevskii]
MASYTTWICVTASLACVVLGLPASDDTEYLIRKPATNEVQDHSGPLLETHLFTVKSKEGKRQPGNRRLNMAMVSMAANNLAARKPHAALNNNKDPVNPYDPGQPAKGFTLRTLGGALTYPSESLKNGTPIAFQVFDNRSAFVECMWTSESSLKSLIENSPNNTHYIFMSSSDRPREDADWLKGQIDKTMVDMMLQLQISKRQVTSLQGRLHYVTSAIYNLGNWIPAVLNYYACVGHGCGYDQIVFQASGDDTPYIMKRLDAHYDWLPSPVSAFGDKSTEITNAGNGCQGNIDVKGKIALLSRNGECSFFTRVSNMQKDGALGVIIFANAGGNIEDMTCQDEECDTQLEIPATMMPYNGDLLNRLSQSKMNATFQHTPSDNFYFGIDGQGKLYEMGWLLYPSFHFLTWQAQWLNFKSELFQNLSKEALVVTAFNHTIMKGDPGVVVTTKLPPMEEMMKYSKVELDTSLSCPGTRDETCPEWDHTVQLYVCCDRESPLCGMELGRWITPFRRRIGRWLTDITPLMPLFTSNICNLTMKTVPWAMPWKPALKIRFSGYKGTQLGCADNVPTGVEPNEHGTWLYGRDGWCDGREVDPWVIDITNQVTKQTTNNVTYYGWYKGTDPDPKLPPGYIIMYSYLVFYKNI